MKNWINLNRGKVLLGLAVIVGFIVVMTFATSNNDVEDTSVVTPVVTSTTE